MKNNGSHFHYFAGANTYKGFISYYDKEFKDTDYLYIIKGGPGTGKSSFMKKIAEKAINEGYSVKEMHCASDTSSLDGVIINELRIGICDGTYPHIKDPKYPSVKDEILNFGEYWDTDMIRSEKENIEYLSNIKSELYNKLYAYLDAANFLRESARKEYLLLTDIQKIRAAAERIIGKYPKGSGFDSEKIQLSAFSMTGTVKFAEFQNSADVIYNISDKRDIGYIFINELMYAAKERGQKIIYSCRADSEHEPDTLYLPDRKVLFIINTDKYDKNINTERFRKKDPSYDNSLYKYIKKCSENLYKSAEDIFSEIDMIHHKLEKAYSSAMDFESINKLYEKIANDIF